MYDLATLTDYVIERGFPERSPIPIVTQWNDFSAPNMAFEGIKDSENKQYYFIDVDRTFQRTSREAILGGLAHECAHISQVITASTLSLVLMQLDKREKNYNYLERKTDALAVERGFGAELEQTLNFVNQYGSPRSEGLSIEEINLLIEGKKVIL